MNFKDEIRAECLDIARACLWERRPIPVSRIQDLADEMAKYAIDKAEDIDHLGGDPRIAVRAVAYLHQQHAMPPFKDDARWFTTMLDAVLTLAYPVELVAKGQPEKFLHDLISGINQSIEDALDPDET